MLNAIAATVSAIIAFNQIEQRLTKTNTALSQIQQVRGKAT
jgi:hypothetical protein